MRTFFPVMRFATILRKKNRQLNNENCIFFMWEKVDEHRVMSLFLVFNCIIHAGYLLSRKVAYIYIYIYIYIYLENLIMYIFSGMKISINFLFMIN